MENITLNIIDEYSAKIKYEMNGALEVKEVKIKPKLNAADISYSCDVSVPVGETIATEPTILKYFEECKIKDVKIFDKFVSAILNRKLTS